MLSWQEIYSGTSYERFNQIINILQNYQIETKVKTTSPRRNMERENPVWHIVESLQEFTVMVKQSDYEEVRFLLRTKMNLG